MGISARGFSAFELLITMVLVAILLAAGIPGFRAYAQNQRIKSAVALLHADLSLARNEAINTDHHAIACPAAESGCAGHSRWQGGWLVFIDINDDRAWQADEPLLRRTNPLEGLTAISASSRRQIRFFPGGSAPGSNSGIVFCDERGVKKGQKVIVSNSGRIRQTPLTDSDAGACAQL